MNIYAKITTEANLEFDEENNSVPVFLTLQNPPPEMEETELKQTIGDLIGILPEFIVLITKEEYDENVEEETPFEVKNDVETGGCSGCAGCNGNCHSEEE